MLFVLKVDQGTACGILVLVYQYFAMHVIWGVTSVYKDASQHHTPCAL